MTDEPYVETENHGRIYGYTSSDAHTKVRWTWIDDECGSCSMDVDIPEMLSKDIERERIKYITLIRDGEESKTTYRIMKERIAIDGLKTISPF